MRSIEHALRVITGLTVVAVVFTAASCGSDHSPEPATPPPPTTVAPSPVGQLIGPEGGTIVHPSGARLVVPPGALAERTRLTLALAQAPSSDVLKATPLGAAVEAGPEGQRFLKPIEVFVPFDPTRLPAGRDVAEAQVRMAPHGGSDFVALDSSVDLPSRTIHTTTVHFTTFVPAQDPNPVFITTPQALPDAAVGAAYAQSFDAVGGTAPYSWSIPAGSVLPPGLTLSPSGSLGGTPTIPSAFGFFVSAGDAAGHTVQKAFALSVLATAAPAPELTTIDPSSVSAGSGTTAIALTGAGFVPSSQALWDGAPLPTTFVSDTSIAASIDGSLLVAAGTHHVSVLSPEPGGGTSASVDFTIEAGAPNPVPTIVNVTPTTLAVTAIDTNIVVVGTDFLPSTSAVIGGQGLPTSYVSSTQLNATIPAADYLSGPGTLQIGVYSPPPAGGFSATTVPITVGNPNAVPVLTAITPSSVPAGFPSAFTITATATNYVVGAQLFFNATALTTTVSGVGVLATVPASLVASAGTATITLVNPTPGGGASVGQTFTIAGVGGATGITCAGSFGGVPSTETNVKVSLKLLPPIAGAPAVYGLDIRSLLAHRVVFCPAQQNLNSYGCAVMSAPSVTPPTATFETGDFGRNGQATATGLTGFSGTSSCPCDPGPTTEVSVWMSETRFGGNVTCSGTAPRADVGDL